VKDAIEAMGVPHTEIDLIVANGVSVGFDYPVASGDRIAVYPVFEGIDISPIVRLRPKPLRSTRFILDTHLGKLARLLRMLGFDARYRNDYRDAELVAIGVGERRIILTRDRGILKTAAVSHGYWLRASDPDLQLREVLTRFDLWGQIKPFQRCMVCNDTITPIAKEFLLERLLPKTARYFDEFYTCAGCQRVYWKGSHYEKMMVYIGRLRADDPN
jgi:uncharacterized protein with PIN domain